MKVLDYTGRMVSRFGVVLAVLAAVQAQEIQLGMSPKGPIKQGDAVTFTCTIPKGMKTFSDLIRYVREFEGTKYSLSTNGQLNENYKSKKEYSIVYDDTSSANGDLIVTFKMTDIQGQDGGNIGCFLYKGTGDKKVVGKMVTVIVEVPVKDVALSVDGGDAVAEGGTLTFKEGETKAAVCVVSVDGSNMPPKTVALRVGDADVTKDAEITPDAKNTVTDAGLLVLSYSQTLKYVPKAADSGKTITCEAKPAQFDAVSKSATLTVQTPPVVKCSEKVSVKAGAENAVLSCTVTGNPLPTTATWSWSHDGAKMSAETGTPKDGYEAKIQNSDGVATVSLTIQNVAKNSFHSYKLSVGNGVRTVEKDVSLTEEVDITTATTTTTTKPTPKPTYKHVTEPVIKEEPKQGQSTSGVNGLASLPLLSATFASLLSVIIVCLL